MRRAMGLFANLRPIRAYPVAGASSLRPDVTRDVDILFVRECAGGIYVHGPRGIDTLADGQRRAVNTQVYTTPEIQRIARVAFEMARRRRRRVTSIDKANAMESGTLWREDVQALRDSEYGDVELRHVYVDDCAYQLAREPRQFDVALADNMFGDILSDGAANIAGSPGMLPSVSLGEADAAGRRRALYEPLHSAGTDIAGQGKANPVGAILCFALALEMTFDRSADARLLRSAVDAALESGAHPVDVATCSQNAVSTSGMGDAILAALELRSSQGDLNP